MYRIIPLRALRSTPRVNFHEVVPSDIPQIHGLDRVIHEPYATSPGPVDDIKLIKRPWYMHPAQDDNLMVLQGERFIDIYRYISLYKSLNISLYISVCISVDI